ncbi:MAG TPA: hypothetical protein VGD55_15260 [Acidothermaceae bacterium]
MSRFWTRLTASLLFVLSLQESSFAVTLGGTQIQSTASATFQTSSAASSSIASNEVTTVVASIGSIAVSPKENGCDPQADVFPIGPLLVKTFSITNNSDVVDAYTVQTATTSAGSIAGVAFVNASGTTTPATVGQTLSQTIQPGASLQVQVSIVTTAIAVGTHVEVSLGARTSVMATINGLQSDSGQACGIASAGASFGAPQGSTALLALLINGQPAIQTSPGLTVTYSLTFENFGAIAATNVMLTDNLPADVQADPSSVKFDGTLHSGASLSTQAVRTAQATSSLVAPNSGQVLSIPLGSIPPGIPETVQFTATVGATVVPGTTYLSNATLIADNAASILTQPAGLFVGTANLVYDGAVGQTHPIANATIQIIDPSLSAALMQPVGPAIAPNTQNTNPFITGPSGMYSFGLSPTQYGSNGTPVTYGVLVTAPGYLNRKLSLTLVPNSVNNLYSATIAALDGQPVASAGAFSLTTGAVSISDVYGFFGNFPLFTTQAVTLTKTADRNVASAGDRIVFTLQFSGNGPTTLGTTTVVDTLPTGLVYASGTGRLDSAPNEPSVNGRTLTWTLSSLTASHSITYATVIMPSVATQATLVNTASISAAFPLSPGTFATASANTSVQVVAGVFSDRIVITGRVFLDDRGTGHFATGDSGVAGVRVYLEDGESVVTDSFGRYSFPAARPGMHVLRIDKTTFPTHVGAYADLAYDSERSIRRLVHGLFDSGLMEDVNFALRRTP